MNEKETDHDVAQIKLIFKQTKTNLLNKLIT